MDPLQQYAQQAGLLPGDPAGLNSDLAGVPSGMLSGYTDEDILASVLPGATLPDGPAEGAGYLTPPVSPFAEPSPQGQAPVLPGAPTGPLKTSESVSIGTRGYSPEKAQQIAIGPGAKGLAGANALVDQQAAADVAALGGMVGDIANQNREAAKAATQAQIDYDTGLAEQNVFLRGEHQKFNDRLQEMEATFAAQENTAKANYVRSLAEYRLNPGQLWQSLGRGEQAGMAAVAFVQDFLGVKGMKTHAMDHWNAAVNRNIEAQVYNIDRATKGFRDLWDMQRAESSSRREAFLRMRGFAMEDLKLGIETHMAQYRNKLTEAQGAAALAKINEAQLQNIFEIIKEQRQHTEKLKQQNLQKYIADLQNSIAGYNAKTARMQEDRMAKEAALAQVQDPSKYLIVSTADDSRGVPVAAVKPEFIKKDGTYADPVNKYLEQQNNTESMNKMIKEYRALLRAHDQGKTPLDRERFRDTHRAKLDALRHEILAARVKAVSGAAATDKEVERLANSIPEDLWLRKYDSESVVAGFQKRAQDQLDDARSVIARDLTPDDSRRGLVQHMGRFDEAGYIDALWTNVNEGKVAESNVDRFVKVTAPGEKHAVRPDAGDVADKDTLLDAQKRSGVDVQNYWVDFQNAQSSEFQAGNRGVRVPASKKAPKWAAEMLPVIMEARQGDPKAINMLREVKTRGEAVAGKTAEERTLKDIASMADFALREVAGSGQDIERGQSVGPVTKPSELDIFNLAIDAGVTPQP